MKNVDFKKLLVFIVIIAIIVVIVFFGIKLIGNAGNTTKEEQEKLTKVMDDYFSVITIGHVSNYNGVDILYNKDKTTYKDLNPAAVLNLATKYAYENNLNTSVSIAQLEELNESSVYGDIKEYTAYSGESIRQAIKELFGEDFDNISVINDSGYIYDFYYVSDFDIYLVRRNMLESYVSEDYNVEYKVLETNKKDKKYYVTVAVAYSYKKDKDTVIYAKDSGGFDIVSDSGNEFPQDKIDEFDKFKFTLNFDKDGHYTFESVEKIS